jgi:ATP-dependent DNA helicase RecG
MPEVKEIESIDILKKAIEAEIKHNYVDITGKKCKFSKFILGELYKISKDFPEDSRWKNLYAVFETYPTTDLPTRMKAIKQLIKHIKSPFEQEEREKQEKKGNFSPKSPEDTDVMYVKGVGPKVSALLNKLGIFTAYDLLHYFPRKHLDYASKTPICNLKAGEEATVIGNILSVNYFTSPRKQNLTIVTINISDGTGTLSINRFMGKTNRYMMERLKAQFPKGAAIIVSGTAKYDDFNHSMTIDKPEMEAVSGDIEECDSLHINRIVPVYPVTENLNVKTLRRAIFNALETFAEYLDDYLPQEIQKNYELIDKVTAIKQIHFPDSAEKLQQARKRLVFEEFFIMQLKLALIRQKQKTDVQGLTLNCKKGGLVDKFVDSLPFKLTGGQKDAFDEIVADISNTEPMRRLLQGDVGCGKTVVAAMSLLAAVENGYQGAIMAPTELLAEQHYKNFVNWLTPLGLSVGLFIGRHGVKIRREMQQNLKNGLINVAVGTHALIQEGVEFNNLGLVVIDEQHRFGVKQRSELKNKGVNPELLAMTATPIPRTLALTMHGDMDLTIINELPPGRKPVKTALVSQKERNKAYKLIEKEIEKGRQAYIVFPLIEESETLSAKAATKEAERLQKGVFSHLKIGLVHGKLAAAEKDKVMDEFRKGEYHILVSTTVIEVGVDVPNATVMMIENAERFGLSQLHQLRGRVGRNSEQAYCVLVSSSSSQDTLKRLEVMTLTNDGFVIAESDLQIRGPGELMGIRQSGIPDLLLADIVKDAHLLEIAREASFNLVKNDNIENYPLLNKRISADVVEIEL